jgi:hypothetical protein
MVQPHGAENTAYVHGHSHGLDGKPTPLYLRWQNMKARCHQPSNKDYPRYGAKGITVCDRWRFGEGGESGFTLFMRDMGEVPFERASLDRIDGTKGYSPDNVRWADMRTQTNNKSTVRCLEIDGVSKPLCEWARDVGIGPKTIHYRLRQGLSAKDAVFLSTDRGRKLPGSQLCDPHNNGEPDHD